MKSSPRRAAAALLPIVAAVAASTEPAEASCAPVHPPGAPPDLVQALVSACGASRLAATGAPSPTPPAAAPVVAPRGSSLALHAAAGGRVVSRLAARTEFGSALRLPVVRRSGAWLGVVSTSLPNGRLGWVRRSETRSVAERPRLHLVVDRSRERLSVLDGGRVLRRLAVGVGGASTPTPTGRFAITDKLDGAAYSAAAYGCCILALSGHQTNLPAGWTGGNRLAIHGGAPGPGSAGCLHASPAALRWLMRHMTAGALVTIRA